MSIITLPGFRSPVDHARRVSHVERLGNLHAEFGRLPRRKLAAGEPLLQVAAVDEVADDVQGPLFTAHLVDADNARMLDLRRRSRLANEHLGIRTIDLSAARDLDRHGSVELRIASLPHRTEMPIADAFQKFEMPDRSYRAGA